MKPKTRRSDPSLWVSKAALLILLVLTLLLVAFGAFQGA